MDDGRLPDDDQVLGIPATADAATVAATVDNSGGHGHDCDNYCGPPPPTLELRGGGKKERMRTV